MDRHTYTEMCFRELAHIIMEPGNSPNLQNGLEGWRPRAEMTLELKSKICLLKNSLLSLGEVSLFPLRPPAEWLRPTRIMESNQFYSNFTNLNVDIIQKQPDKTPRIMFY